MSTPTNDCATVTTAELQRVLGSALRERLGPGAGIARLDRAPFASATSFPIEELEIVLADGREMRLLLKSVAADALLPASREAKPEIVRDSTREVHVYRHLLAGAGLGTAECYAAVADEARGSYWLVLERVPGVELFQEGTLASWMDAARWLAVAHERLAHHAGAHPHAPLLRYDAEHYRVWPRRALEFAGGRAGRWLERLEASYERVVARLLALPTTVIHGEFYASNILVAGPPAARRICPVDWEMAAIGPGLVDLAALTAGSWTEWERAAMAMAYYESGETQRHWPDVEPFLHALDLCRLHVAMQWLGWSRSWTPPTEHAHDWLGEAMALAGSIDP